MRDWCARLALCLTVGTVTVGAVTVGTLVGGATEAAAQAAISAKGTSGPSRTGGLSFWSDQLQGDGKAGSIKFVDAAPGTLLGPDIYVVKSGDTLWDICGVVFNNPFVWPKVWALNPHITNPHWIYPGDVLRLRQTLQGDTVVSRQGDTRRRPAPSMIYVNAEEDAVQEVVNVGYLAGEDEEEPLGDIIASPSANLWLDQTSRVYVKFKDLSQVQLGQRYTVYTRGKEITHPDSGKELGNKVRVRGVVEIVRVDEKVATGRMVKSYTEIERGALVGPLEEHYRRVSPQQNLIDLDGFVVERVQQITMLGQSELLFIDRGAEDGVQVGNRFKVIRRGDGSKELDEDVLELLPWEEIGELLVVDTRPGSSTVLVTRAEKDLKIGDRISMRRNY
ncbi:MAG: LysM peptidoglycan-binding domain-containing protein [Bradymonadia bacterium]